MITKAIATRTHRIRRRKRKDDKRSSIRPENQDASGLVRLQQAIGNRAVQQVIAQRALERGELGSHALMRELAEEAAAKPKAVEEKTLSGASWYDEFPTSTSVGDLDGTFSGKVQKFIAAVEKAGAKVEITATKRPAERAYLMHWAWLIAKKGYNPRKVPSMKGVNINWWHGDKAASKDAAQEMCDKYAINKLKVSPSLKSYHIVGKAIDMKISWGGDLIIKNAKGIDILIQSSPKNHTNAALIAVALTYQVIHFSPVDKDKVHWSVDGR